MSSGLANNTMKQYTSGQKRYLEFCRTLRAAPCPATELLLLRFVASISDSLSGYTIQNYLSAVRYLHVANGHINPISNFERLKLVIKALKKRSAPTRKRSPVSVSMLRSIHQVLQTGHFNDTALWAMIAIGFFGFLRVSEFTVEGSFDPHFDLCLEDLSLGTDFSHAALRLKSSKSDPFKKGCSIVLGSTGQELCPIRA